MRSLVSKPTLDPLTSDQKPRLFLATKQPVLSSSENTTAPVEASVEKPVGNPFREPESEPESEPSPPGNWAESVQNPFREPSASETGSGNSENPFREPSESQIGSWQEPDENPFREPEERHQAKPRPRLTSPRIFGNKSKRGYQISTGQESDTSGLIDSAEDEDTASV